MSPIAITQPQYRILSVTENWTDRATVVIAAEYKGSGKHRDCGQTFCVLEQARLIEFDAATGKLRRTERGTAAMLRHKDLMKMRAERLEMAEQSRPFFSDQRT